MPDISSAQEIQAAETNKGTDKAPDVFDLGPSVAIASLSYFAPYKVSNFDQIPAGNKAAGRQMGRRLHRRDGGRIQLDQVRHGQFPQRPARTRKFKGAVALNGNPTQAGAGFNGVVMASLANGGSADNIAPGVDYFAALKAAGTFLPVDPILAATVESGTTGVVFDWSYNQLAFTTALKAEGVDWKTFVPDNAAVGSYYVQAINVDAPHPAAARLWQEYLYSDAAQNMFMKGGAKPVLYDVMKAAGTIDAASAANLPTFAGTLTQLTADQNGHGQFISEGELVEGQRLSPTLGPRTFIRYGRSRTVPCPRTGNQAAAPGAGRSTCRPHARHCSVLRLRGGIPSRPDDDRDRRRVQVQFGRLHLGQHQGAGTRDVIDALSAVVLRRGHRRSSGRSSGDCCLRVSTGDARVMRKVVAAACSVLAQFGGVMLAFAFIATVGSNGSSVLPDRSSAFPSTGLAVHDAGADLRLQLLPDPADGDGLPACGRRHPPPMAGGGCNPRVRSTWTFWRGSRGRC